MNRKRLKGKLKIQRKKGKEWGYILIDRYIWFNRKDLFIKNEDCWLNPGYDPHISIFTKEEIKKIPNDFDFGCNEVEFILTGETKIVNPKTWTDVYSCIFEIVECEWAENIRKSLNFSPFIRNDHEFHITLGIKTIPSK